MLPSNSSNTTLLHGWQDEAVKDALDLCLACKGCKVDCPVNVDMATYKAEFLSHYYEKHARPRSAFAFGLIYKWAQLASHAPRVANIFTQTPFLSDLGKWIAGMAPQRRIPAFAPQTFRAWFLKREHGEHYTISIKAGERVLLPAVRNADKDTLIIADGFSCREQIAQTTDRHALHLAEVIQMAMENQQPV